MCLGFFINKISGKIKVARLKPSEHLRREATYIIYMLKLFKGKKVTVMGLGLNNGGVGVAKYFCENGADVLVTDLKTKKELAKSLLKLKKYKIKYRLGEHKEEDFIKTDLVIKNPAVPASSKFLQIARDNNVKVDTDTNIFFNLCPSKIIGVTGTKGKSTTATLIYELVKAQNKKAFLAGNIGVSPLEILNKITPDAIVVLELSNFELEELERSPHIAAITTVLPDHLNRYKSYNDYIATKRLIFKYQKAADHLVLNYDNEITRNFAKLSKSNVYLFSSAQKANGCFMDKEEIFFNGEKEPIFNVKKLQIFGEHNVSNVLAAVTVAKVIGLPNDKIRKILQKFTGVPNRQELVAEKKGVKYINDTTATMPEAVIFALRATRQRFPKAEIVLILGGMNKELYYAALAVELEKAVKQMVLLPGSASEIIEYELSTRNSKIKITKAVSMEDAVKKAGKLAKRGDVILLSPGATSFNLFKNEFDRGDQFVAQVKKIK